MEQRQNTGHITFEDVAVYFSESEWDFLEEWQKELYRTVMKDNYETVSSLGLPVGRPDFLSKMGQERETWHQVKEEARGYNSGPGNFIDHKKKVETMELSNVTNCPVGPRFLLAIKSEQCQKSYSLENGRQSMTCPVKLEKHNSDSFVQDTATLVGTSYLECGSGKGCRIQKNHETKPNLSAVFMGSDQPVESRQVVKKPDKIFPCDICKKTFTKINCLKSHTKVHTGEKPFMCRYCGRGYTRSNYLKIHSRMHTGEKVYKCSKCDKSFKERSILREHRKTHLKLGKRGRRVKSISDLEASGNDDTSNPEKVHWCNVCEKSFSKSYNLKVHQRIHTGEKPYQCPKCEKCFAQNAKLKIHRTTHEEWAHEVTRLRKPKPAAPMEKLYKCNVCEKSFSKSYTLKVHLRTHTGEKPYTCDECHKSFSKNNLLTVHKRTHSGEKPYQCLVCLKSFSVISHLRVHKRTHTGERPYKCAECIKCFSDYSSLFRHQRIHSGAKPYQCNVCEKSFREKSHLTVHRRTHTGERPYKCTQCDKTFSDCSSFVEHRRSHTGARPYTCEVCKKSFTKAYTLKIHLRVHTGERPYKCNQCPKSFSINYHLKVHERLHLEDTDLSATNGNGGKTAEAINT